MEPQTPPHFASVVRDFLDEKFLGRWIGRRGPIEWPARSRVGLCETECQSAFKTKEDTSNIFFSLHSPRLFAQCDL